MGEAEDSEQQTVLFADVVGSTRIYRELGDSLAEAAIFEALERVRKSAEARNGHQVKTIGDCSMCVFADAADAMEAAIEVQNDALAPLKTGDLTVRFRVGFCAGAVVERDGDCFGDAVNVAARLGDLAKENQILTTADTVELLGDALKEKCRLFDKTQLKGISETFDIMQVMWEQSGATTMFEVPADIANLAAGLRLWVGGKKTTVLPTQTTFRIGRQAPCELVVEAPFASRTHARILVQRGKFVLKDESTNGTFVVLEGGDDKPIYVRNEAFTLLGSGSMTLGVRPEQDQEHLIRFEVF